MVTNKIVFLASNRQPSEKEVDYWIDTSSDVYGRIIKVFTGKSWENIAATINPNDYYTKSQVQQQIDKALENIDVYIAVPLEKLQAQIDALTERVSVCEETIDDHTEQLNNITSITEKEIEDL